MYVRVRVTTKAKKEAVTPEGSDRLRICVRERAERNAANVRVITLVARHFQVPEESVRLVRGHHRPSKLLEVDIPAS